MIDLHPKVCPLCGGKVEYTTTSKVYDTDYMKYGGSGYCYHCTKCDAIVLTHKHKPDEAFGILANKEMREMRQKNHKLFDQLWRNRSERSELYIKLSKELGIDAEECHFGCFTMEQLQKSHEILMRWWREKYDR